LSPTFFWCRCIASHFLPLLRVGSVLISRIVNLWITHISWNSRCYQPLNLIFSAWLSELLMLHPQLWLQWSFPTSTRFWGFWVAWFFGHWPYIFLWKYIWINPLLYHGRLSGSCFELSALLALFLDCSLSLDVLKE